MKNKIFKSSILPAVYFLFVILSIIVLSSICSDDPPIASTPTLDEDLQKTLDAGLVKYSGKGISVAVIMPDGYMWKSVSGVSHSSIKLTADMVFSAGSYENITYRTR
jgi:hypothetical protein